MFLAVLASLCQAVLFQKVFKTYKCLTLTWNSLSDWCPLPTTIHQVPPRLYCGRWRYVYCHFAILDNHITCIGKLVKETKHQDQDQTAFITKCKGYLGVYITAEMIKPCTYSNKAVSNHESRLLSRSHTFAIIVILDLKIQNMWIHWPFFPKTWTKGHWPLDDLWPHVCWGHMCDSTQGSLCPSPMTIHQCMWIQWSILQNTTYIHTYYILHTYILRTEWVIT